MESCQNSAKIGNCALSGSLGVRHPEEEALKLVLLGLQCGWIRAAVRCCNELNTENTKMLSIKKTEILHVSSDFKRYHMHTAFCRFPVEETLSLFFFLSL